MVDIDQVLRNLICLLSTRPLHIPPSPFSNEGLKRLILLRPKRKTYSHWHRRFSLIIKQLYLITSSITGWGSFQCWQGTTLATKLNNELFSMHHKQHLTPYFLLSDCKSFSIARNNNVNRFQTAKTHYLSQNLPTEVRIHNDSFRTSKNLEKKTLISKIITNLTRTAQTPLHIKSKFKYQSNKM